MVVAYLRVSTDKQDVKNQRSEIILFAQRKGVEVDKWVEEVVSGKNSKECRKLGNIVSNMKPDDTLVVSELSRLSRTIFESINILDICLRNRFNLWSVKENYTCTNDISSIIMGIMSSIFSGLERTLTSLRTKEALARKKKEGVILGRPVGRSKIWNRLLNEKERIKSLLEEKITKTEIAIRLGISRVTLYKFIATL